MTEKKIKDNENPFQIDDAVAKHTIPNSPAANGILGHTDLA